MSRLLKIILIPHKHTSKFKNADRLHFDIVLLLSKKSMNILEFFELFPNEESCRAYFRLVREKEGVVCKKCGEDRHWWLKAKWQWQCSSCNFRTTLRSGTMMESSNLPLMIWFKAMALMSFSKKGISACELSRQLGGKRYETVWSLMHKIRKGMGNRDSRYRLADMMEFDEGYFVTETSKKEHQETKAGRGSNRVQNVAVLAESTPLEDLKTGKVSRHCRYFKMKVFEDHAAEGVDQFLQESIYDKSIVFSDQSTSYVNIADYVDVHISEKSSEETTTQTLKWVHIAISNAKRTLLGIYHKIKGKYLQLYLDEFCYKLNRRYFGEKLFDRLVIAISDNYRYDCE